MALFTKDYSLVLFPRARNPRMRIRKYTNAGGGDVPYENHDQNRNSKKKKNKNDAFVP